MSQYDIIRDCRVDGIYPIDVDRSRHYLRVVVTMREPPASKRKDAAADEEEEGDDCENDADEEEEEDDEDGVEAEEELFADEGAAGGGAKPAPKKRRRAQRLPRTRGTINIDDRLPLMHVGATMRLVLRPELPADGSAPDETTDCVYKLLECMRYAPAAQLRFGGIRGALSDAAALLARRAERIARHRSLAAANLATFGTTSAQSGIKDVNDAGLPKAVRDALLSLGVDLLHPVQLATLQSPFKTGVEASRRRALETGLRGFYALQSSLLSNLGDAESADRLLRTGAQRGLLQPFVVARALATLALPPHNARASLLEQLSVAQLLACADERRTYIDAMFAPPACDAVSSRRLCADDALRREWRLAAPDQHEMQQRARAMTQILAALPIGADLGFLWSAAEWFQTTTCNPHGSTLFECGEPRELVARAHEAWQRVLRNQAQMAASKRGRKKKKSTIDTAAAPPPPPPPVDDAEHSEELWMPDQTPAWAQNDAMADDEVDEGEEAHIGACAASRTHWLWEQNEFIEPAPAECWLKSATTQLFMTTRAGALARRLVQMTKALIDTERLVLCVVHTSGHGTAGVDDATFGERIVFTADVRQARVDESGRLPLVVLVFRSHAARDRYRVWLAEHRAAPDRFSLATLTLEQVLADRELHWSVRVRLARAARVVVVDAHLLCEHDMAGVLAAFVALNDTAGELALCGEVDTLLPEAHCESGAPFVDMWRAQVARTVDIDGGARGMRGCYVGASVGGTAAQPRLATDALTSVPVRQALVEALLRNVVVRARDLAQCLLGGACTVQIAGYGRRALEAGLHTLADFLRRHLEKSDARRALGGPEPYERALAVRDALALWAREPWRAASTLVATMPFVKYRTLVLRYDGAFVGDAETPRGERLRKRAHLRAIDTKEPLLSLDTLNLYLMLDEVAHELSGVDHRSCCFTEDARLMSVARHRHELRGASVMLARHAAAGVDVNASRMCLLLRAAPGGLSYGDQLDAEQLLVAPLRCTDAVRLILPHATPEQVRATAATLVKPMGFFHRAPPTALCTMLELAVKQCATTQAPAPTSAGDFCWEDDIDALLAE